MIRSLHLCASISITVNTLSVAPASIDVTQSTICNGESTTLSENGGVLGSGATWQWYTDGCGTTSAGSGASLVVSPSVTTTYYLRAEGSCVTTSCLSTTIIVNDPSVAPVAAIASATTICEGGSTTLSVVGGTLGTGGSWQWYADGCGTTSIGAGSSINVSPAATTTYYARAEGTCDTTVCASVTITVEFESVAPTGITATANPICDGTPTTLSIIGGSLGNGADWYWYTGSCGGTPVGTGNSIAVSPSATTTYYARAEGSCNTTSCASVQIVVDSESSDPVSATATVNPLCEGQVTALTVNGGSLGTGASWQWYTDGCGTTFVGTGTTVSVNPATDTEYWVRAEGTCNTTLCVSINISVNSLSTTPSFATATPATICEGSTSTLSISGGSLGSGAAWEWYTGSCGGTLVGSGSSVIVSPTATTIYYARGVGTCNSTSCVSVQVTVNTLSVVPDALVATPASLCIGSSTLSIVNGSLGTGASWQWYSGSCGGTYIGSGAIINVFPTATTTYYVRAEGTCNNTSCVDATVTIIPTDDPYFEYATSTFCQTGADPSPTVITTPGGVFTEQTGGLDIDGATGTITLASSTINTYTITYTTLGSCPDSSSIQLTVTDAPTAGFAYNGPYCGSGMDPLPTFIGTGSAGVFTSLPGLVFTNPGTGRIDLDASTPGTYWVYNTIAPAGGCSAAIDSAQVTINEPATISLENDTICEGDVYILTSTIGGSATTVSWSTPDGTGVFDAVNYTPSAADILSAGVILIATTDDPDGAGPCPAANDNMNLEINNLPEIYSVLVDDISCFGQTDGEISISANDLDPLVYSIDDSSTYQASNIFSNLIAGSYIIVVQDDFGCTEFGDTVQILEPTLLQASISDSSMVGCFGATDGSATVSATGGTPSYTYAWSNSGASPNQLNLAAGIYTVIVSDANSCTDEASVTIAEPAQGLIITVPDTTHVTCSGGTDGSITLNVNGGTPTYSYIWNYGYTDQSPTNIPAGVHIVTVTDSEGCSMSDTIVLTEPDSAVITTIINVINPGCGLTNGEATVDIEGGTSPYTILWSANSGGQTTAIATGLSAATYYVTVTDDNGCASVKSVSLSNSLAPTINITNSTDILCNGDGDGSADIIVFGGTPYTVGDPYVYEWTDNIGTVISTTTSITNVSGGTYSIVVTDSSGCIALDSVLIVEPLALNLSINPTDIPCFGNSNGVADLTVIGGTLPMSYYWNTTQTSPDISGLAAGTYYVTVTDANACIDSSNVIITGPAVPLTAFIITTDVLCYGAADGTADLTVVGGSTPYTYFWNSGQSTEDISGLSAGAYSVTVTDMNNCVTTASGDVDYPFTLMLSDSVAEVSCYGSTDGEVYLNVSNGTTPYTYLWSTGGTSDSLASVGADTVFVTVTDANGCQLVSDSIIVTQPDSIKVTYVAKDVKCYGDVSGSIDLNVTGGKPAYDYFWVGGYISQDRINLSIGTYFVTVTDNAGCIASDSIEIGQPDTSIYVNITSVNNPCYGDTLGMIDLEIFGGTPFLPDSTYNLSWNYGQTDSTLVNLSAGDYQVTITDANYCKYVDTVTIIQPGQLIIEPGHINSTCDLDNGSAWVNVSQGTPPYSYLWTNMDTTMLTDSLAGYQDYTVLVTDTMNCQSIMTISIGYEGSPVLIINNIDNVDCYGGFDGSAGVMAIGGTLPYSFEWSTGDLTSNITGQPADSLLAVVIDDNGCRDSIDVVIAQPDSLYAMINVTAALCFGDSTGTATVAAFGGTGFPTNFGYEWNTSDSTINVDSLSAGSYVATVTDMNGCVAVTDSVTLTQPVVPLTVDSIVYDALCYEHATGWIDLEVYGGTPDTTGGDSVYSFTWSSGAFTEDAQNLYEGVYLATVTDYNGCSNFLSFYVGQPDDISVYIDTIIPAACGDTNGVILVDHIEGGTSPFTWSWSAGLYTDSVITDSITALPYGIDTVFVTDANGCLYERHYSVANQGDIEFDPSINQILCFGGTGDITVTPTNGLEPYFYEWSDGQTSQVADNLYSGTYTVTVTDINGCDGSGQFIINPEPSQLNVYATGFPVSCWGDNDGQVLVTGNGGTPYYHIQVIDTATFLPIFDTIGTLSGTAIGLAPGGYFVRIYDNNNCPTSTNVTVTEPLRLETGNEDITIVRCFGGSDGLIQMNPIEGNGGYSFMWSNGQNASAAINLTTGDYSVTVTDIKGCSDSETIFVDQNPLIVIFDSITETSCRDHHDGAIELNVTGGVQGYTYLWSASKSDNETLTDQVTGNPVTELIIDEYTATVTDANGCTMVDTIDVGYIDFECLRVHTAMTPNLDDVNDTWIIENIDLYEDISISVFNRWGDIVYEFSGKSGEDYELDEWDGTYKGREVPVGPYMFILDLHNDLEPKTGTVTIIR